MAEPEFRNEYVKHSIDLNEADTVLELTNKAAFAEDTLFLPAPRTISANLNRLRHAKSRLDTALEYLAGLSDVPIGSSVALCIFEAAITKYFSCFRQGESAPHLDANDVFKGQVQLRASHDELKRLRDSFLNHPSGDHFSVHTFIATNGRDVIDTPSFLITFRSHSGEDVKALIELCSHSSHVVEEKLSAAMKKAHAKAGTYLKNKPQENLLDMERLARFLLETCKPA